MLEVLVGIHVPWAYEKHWQYLSLSLSLCHLSLPPYIYIHTHKYTLYIQIYISTHTHIYRNTCMYLDTHTHALQYIYAYIDTCVHRYSYMQLILWVPARPCAAAHNASLGCEGDLRTPLQPPLQQFFYQEFLGLAWSYRVVGVSASCR